MKTPTKEVVGEAKKKELKNLAEKKMEVYPSERGSKGKEDDSGSLAAVCARYNIIVFYVLMTLTKVFYFKL